MPMKGRRFQILKPKTLFPSYVFGDKTMNLVLLILISSIFASIAVAVTNQCEESFPVVGFGVLEDRALEKKTAGGTRGIGEVCGYGMGVVDHVLPGFMVAFESNQRFWRQS
ncbi:hypothetical protein PRUPE_6G317200 [Prunus persica]|uniref:Uncharacterized protein n=1 Tax=Prunus persica TaxID=3760 RepID=A0A251NYJ6_PRUPE|nr:hypothetical protein PRUPE_6G317200 [Prunus persica]